MDETNYVVQKIQGFELRTCTGKLLVLGTYTNLIGYLVFMKAVMRNVQSYRYILPGSVVMREEIEDNR